MRITLELPTLSTDDKASLEAALDAQTHEMVETLRGLLNHYKKLHGIRVPSITVKRLKRPAPKAEDPARDFAAALLEHHLKNVPTANVPQQRKAIRMLWEGGFTDAVRLIETYDRKRAAWPATNWFTVYYEINRAAEREATATHGGAGLDFERAELSAEDIEQIRKRLTYGRQNQGT